MVTTEWEFIPKQLKLIFFRSVILSMCILFQSYRGSQSAYFVAKIKPERMQENKK
jgi:hypothetical protein